MNPTEFWIRLAAGVAMMVLGFVLQLGTPSLVLALLGVLWIIWAIIVAARQVRRAEEVKRNRL